MTPTKQPRLAESIAPTHPALVLTQLVVPALAVMTLAALVAHHLRHALAMPAACAIVSGTLLVYCLDRLTDHRDTAHLRQARRWATRHLLLPLMAVGSSIVVAALVCASLPVLWSVILLGVISVAYQFAKHVAGIKTVLVAGAWTIAIAMIAAPASAAALYPCAAIFLMVAGSAILCDLKDADQDRRTGVRSLVVICGRRAATALACGLCLLAAAVAVGDHAPWLAITALAQVLACSCRRLLEKPVLGPLLLDALLALFPLLGLCVDGLSRR
jgi:4-hydroxybenzoate polyprenyltransferase